MEILSSITINLNRIVPIFQIVLGTFGNIMNILIFTRRSLRKNPCSTYFLALSINNLFFLYVALLTRLLASGWDIDPFTTNTILCKLRTFLVYVSFCLVQWLIVLASIDRFLSTCYNVRCRQFSNKSASWKATIITVTFIIFIHFHIPIWWSSDYVDSIPVCNIFNKVYDIFFSTFDFLLTCILPPLLMVIFGIKTLLNVRKIRIQVTPLNHHRANGYLRSKDRQFLTMHLFQVLITIICTTPFTVVNLYSTIQSNLETSVLNPSDMVIYNFLANISRLLSYCNPVISFYIYTLISRSFRTQLKHVLKHGLSL